MGHSPVDNGPIAHYSRGSNLCGRGGIVYLGGGIQWRFRVFAVILLAIKGRLGWYLLPHRIVYRLLFGCLRRRWPSDSGTFSIGAHRFRSNEHASSVRYYATAPWQSKAT
jgi:hypothetical protein